MIKQNWARSSCELPFEPLWLFLFTLYTSREARKGLQKAKLIISMNWWLLAALLGKEKLISAILYWPSKMPSSRNLQYNKPIVTC